MSVKPSLIGAPAAAQACGCPSRRALLAAGLGLAATAAAPAPARRRIIDVHTHFITPELRRIGAAPPMMGWELSRLLADMDAAGVAVSVLSITSPGVVGVGPESRRLVGGANDLGARMVHDYPRRLRFFAYLQPLDVDFSLQEARRAFDTLGASGVILFTSHQGKYLGDSVFDPLFEELNRRRAVVLVHPNSPACCRGVLPLPDTAIEYGTDTTRAMANYVYSGAARRFSDVRMIWNHAGGTMPSLIERFDVLDRTGQFRTAAPEGFRAALRRFHFDVAQAANRVNTGALRQIVGPDRILFGTDYPFRTLAEHVGALEGGGVFSRAELDAIFHGNVERDLPALLPPGVARA